MKQIHLSETKLSQLATEISNRLFESHYFNQDVISGEALNNFCDHEQVNKFLLFQVYQVWQLQISRFKHPYFDFDHSEVSQLLAQLQNLLSRNIAIKKEDFKPLLYKAVLNNLRLLTDPREALQQFFFQNQDKISLEMYEKYSPFFSDFDFVINSIERYYQKNGIQTVEKDVFLLKFDRVLEVYNQRSEQNANSYRDLRFFKLTNNRLEEVLKADQEESALRKIKEQEAAEKQRLLAEKQREEAEKKKQEEERLKQEARAAEEDKRKRNKLSFFDELPAHVDNVIDLQDEGIDDKATPVYEGGDIKGERTIEITEVPQAQEPVSKENEPARSETVKDQIKEEEPFWKKMQEQVDMPATQADRLKEATHGKTDDSLLDRFKKKEEIPTESEVPQEPAATTKEARPQEDEKNEAKEEAEVNRSTFDEIKDKREKAAGTIFNKATDDNEKQDDGKPSVLENAASESKPASLVDLLKARENGNKEKSKEEKQAEAKVEKQASVKTEDVPKEDIKQEPTPEKESKSGSLLDRFRRQTKPSEKASPLASAREEEKPQTVAESLKDQPSAPIAASAPVEDKKEKKETPKDKNSKADEIPIHKQYRFVQKVFGGNNVRFRIIVDKINNANSSAEVEDILEKYVFSNSDVDREDETVKEFVMLMGG